MFVGEFYVSGWFYIVGLLQHAVTYCGIQGIGCRSNLALAEHVVPVHWRWRNKISTIAADFPFSLRTVFYHMQYDHALLAKKIQKLICKRHIQYFQPPVWHFNI